MLKLVKDYRIGGKPTYHLRDEEINQMQVPDKIRKCVVFIYCQTESGKEPYGTGFSVCEDVLGDTGRIFTFIITAKHVLIDIGDNTIDNKVWLRINLKNGDSKFIDVNLKDWIDHPTDDVSVLMLKLSKEWDIICYPIEFIVNDTLITQQKIGIGDETFTIGLFSKHSGKTRNIPIVRVGNISAMPEEKIKIKEDVVDAYLIETRSFGGLSGSPVFVNLGSIRNFDGKILIKQEGGYVFFLLGLIRAHWDWKSNGYDLFGRDIDIEEINLGIAVVTPATKIFEAINLPPLFERKQKNIEAIIKELQPTEDIIKKDGKRMPKNTKRSTKNLGG